MTAVVGIDPSLTGTGIATPDGVCTIRSGGQRNATLRERRNRIDDLAGQILLRVGEVYTGAQFPLLVVIERQIPGANGHQHDRAGLWWLIVSDLLSWTGVDVVEVTPSQRMKYATGKGRADKDEVLAAVIRRYPDVNVRNNNEADSLVFRAMGCDHLGVPLVPVPQTHRAALEKVAWPDMKAASA